MAGLGNNSAAAKAAAAPNNQIGGYTSATAGGQRVSSGGFLDDNARRLPSSSDAVSKENARKKALGLSAGSGRQATNLNGTIPYVNTFLGGTL